MWVKCLDGSFVFFGLAESKSFFVLLKRSFGVFCLFLVCSISKSFCFFENMHRPRCYFSQKTNNDRNGTRPPWRTQQTLGSRLNVSCARRKQLVMVQKIEVRGCAPEDALVFRVVAMSVMLFCDICDLMMSGHGL